MAINIQPIPVDMEIKNKRNGIAQFNRSNRLRIGSGDNIMMADKQGLWLGAKKFGDAPFRVNMDGDIVGLTLDAPTITGGTITGTTITGGTIQTATSGKRLRIAGSPANEYQFLDGGSKVGHLKIDDDGAGGFFAELLIDFLASGGSILKVGSAVGVAEITYFSAPFISTSGRAAVGRAAFDAKGKYFGLDWSGGGDPLVRTDALPTSDPGVSGALWNDSGTVKISP
jgi:hypothetical protein